VSESASPKWVFIEDYVISRLLTLSFPILCFRYRRRGLYASASFIGPNDRLIL